MCGRLTVLLHNYTGDDVFEGLVEEGQTLHAAL